MIVKFISRLLSFIFTIITLIIVIPYSVFYLLISIFAGFSSYFYYYKTRKLREEIKSALENPLDSEFIISEMKK